MLEDAILLTLYLFIVINRDFCSSVYKTHCHITFIKYNYYKLKFRLWVGWINVRNLHPKAFMN